MTCELQITSGFHSGAMARLSDQITVIGSSDACDLVLSDEGIAARHMSLERARGSLALTALDADVEVVGKGLVPAGHRADIPHNATVRLAATDIQVESTRADFMSSLPELPQIRFPRYSPAVLAVACVPMAFAAFALTPNTTSIDGQDAPGALASQMPPEPTAEERLEAAIALFETKLEASGIDTVHLAPRDGVVVATGTVFQANTDAWHQLERWFDGAYAGQIAMVNNVSGTANPPSIDPPAIQSVWQSDTPFLTIDNSRYHEGATLPNGWVLASIGPAAASFEYDNRTIEIRY